MTNLFEELESKKCNAEDLCGGDFRSEDTAVVRLDRIRNAVASAREELKKAFPEDTNDCETIEEAHDILAEGLNKLKKRIDEVLGEK